MNFSGSAGEGTVSEQVVLDNAQEYLLFDDLDLENRKFVTWKGFEEGVHALVEQITAHQEKNGSFSDIYAVPRGGLVLGVKLSYLLDLPLITDKEKVTPKTLIVDDCIKTGGTLAGFTENRIAVLYWMPNAKVTPDFLFEESGKQINFCWESARDRN